MCFLTSTSRLGARGAGGGVYVVGLDGEGRIEDGMVESGCDGYQLAGGDGMRWGSYCKSMFFCRAVLSSR